ncbi:hypothetical protein CCACVL1_08318 [Corchorus capsularis]|uniref:Uncharacterized protein n=1 Tax=Corchorus capsularis TaxID=210143 RepID=A0A1R3J164_COCAP|nr:hypothetical protein CCACVL1_08318 [Corchorus capsularis]
MEESKIKGTGQQQQKDKRK